MSRKNLYLLPLVSLRVCLLVHGMLLNSCNSSRALLISFCLFLHRVSKGLLPYVGGVGVGAVACGFGRAFGNKVSYFYSMCYAVCWLQQ